MEVMIRNIARICPNVVKCTKLYISQYDRKFFSRLDGWVPKIWRNLLKGFLGCSHMKMIFSLSELT